MIKIGIMATTHPVLMAVVWRSPYAWRSVCPEIPTMAKKTIETQSLNEKASRNRLSFRSWTSRRRNPPIPNRRVKRVKGWTSLKATLVAMKENPQKITAHNAGQDKEPSFFRQVMIKWSVVLWQVLFKTLLDSVRNLWIMNLGVWILRWVKGLLRGRDEGS